MDAAVAAWIAKLLRGVELPPAGQEAANRMALEGLTWRAMADGRHELRLRTLEIASIQLASGPHTMALGRLVVQGLVGQLRLDGAKPELIALEAASAELTDLALQGPLSFSAPAGAGPWKLGPLAEANGTVRAEIIDAHLLFDADVTVPVRHGRIDFKDATVEHVGPDSRMGVSRLGIYVDAPNGRSYLYQFPVTPLTGVEFEERGALLGAVSDRGALLLQAFAEATMSQALHGPGLGLTAQARQILDRTAIEGEVRLGDGALAMPGLEAEFTGRAQGRNAVRLHSEAVGRGVTCDIPSLAVRQVFAKIGGAPFRCDDIAGAMLLRLSVAGTTLNGKTTWPKLELRGLRYAGDTSSR
ncbi:hypothetical protein FN976_04985 [Caenimonas sedimenti]|uniref:Uncharacterized protein n=1 Tax=Caenimonas sedimenti TaxID=2596921 RepID=A0A562ZUT4_9BURK|nr:hypothetical protein [Caenimonas sedimenti]TWO72075.1 hypothetical protein FN976_04985 [Caenimonas sedimenti]